jgi:hypothetical protein
MRSIVTILVAVGVLLTGTALELCFACFDKWCYYPSAP